MPEIPAPDCITAESDPVRKAYLEARLVDLQRSIADPSQGSEAGEAVLDRMDRQGFGKEAQDLLDWLGARVLAGVIAGRVGALALIGLIELAAEADRWEPLDP